LKRTRKVLSLLFFLVLVVILYACSISPQVISGEKQNSLQNMKTAAIRTVESRINMLTSSAPSPTVTSTTIYSTPIPSESIQYQTPLTFTPNPVFSPTPNSKIQNEPCEKAEFLDDITIPDGTSVNPGFSFLKTWRIKNTGTCAWTAAYQLVFVGGNLSGENGIIPLKNTANPGEIIDLTIPLVAPSQPGVYEGYWKLRNPQGYIFGTGDNGSDAFWVKIVVVGSEQETQREDVTINIATPTSARCNPILESSIEATLLRLINQERVKNGSFILISQTRLSEVAREYSIDLACKTSQADIPDVTTRLKNYHYVFINNAVNIYLSRDVKNEAEVVFTSWMKNDTYRKNILNNDFSQIGIGYALSESGEYGNYCIAIFAQP